MLLKFDTINRRTCMGHILSLLRTTKVSQIVSDCLVGFVDAKLLYHLDVSDRELYLGFSYGTASLVQALLLCKSVREGKTLLQLGLDFVQQCLKKAVQNADSGVRTATLSWLLSNGVPSCTEGLLLALSCGREDMAWEMITGGVVVTKECVAIAQSHASPEMVLELTEQLAAKAKGTPLWQLLDRVRFQLICVTSATIAGSARRSSSCAMAADVRDTVTLSVSVNIRPVIVRRAVFACTAMRFSR
jgi:hypothetical protein